MTERMLKILLISAILFRDAPAFVINNICNQYVDDISLKVISSVDRKSKLIQARGSEVSSLIGRLIENATAIRQDIVDTFTCEGRVYGYYADQDNDCQIFHVCLPMQQLYPEMYCEEDIFHFSFICPLSTIFNQEAMVCDWTKNAFPCSEADQLYARNNLFFVVPEEDVQRESSLTSSTSPAPKRPSLCCSNRKTTTVSQPDSFRQRLRSDSEAIATTQGPPLPSIILDEDDENHQDALNGSLTAEREDITRSTTTVSLDNDSRARFDHSELFESDSSSISELDTFPLRQISTTSAHGPSHNQDFSAGAIFSQGLNRQSTGELPQPWESTRPKIEEPGTSFSGVSNIFSPLPDDIKVVDIIEEQQTFPSGMKDEENSQTMFPSAVEVVGESLTTFSSAEESQKNFASDLKNVEEFQTSSPSDPEAVEESQISPNNLTEVKKSPTSLTDPFEALVYEDEASTDAYQPIFITHEESSSIYSISEITPVMDDVVSEANIVTKSFWNVPTSEDPPSFKSLAAAFEAQRQHALSEKTATGSPFGLQSEHRPVTFYENSYGFNGWRRKQAEVAGNSRSWDIRSY
ncbi:serine-rich adhesin for platelets-like [Palaemon carinicauda]|uniref:serine-rich adhesin for platelets-like n=1 Tax=Palaemon carinicauda TaxID=392227 RepID=UPI0035B59AD1